MWPSHEAAERASVVTGVLYAIARFCVRRRFARAGRLVRCHGRARGDLAPARRQHQRQPVAAGNRQPARDQHPGEGVPQSGERVEPDRAACRRTASSPTPTNANAVNSAAAAVAKAPDVASVVNPLTPQGAAALSKDQSTGYLSVTLSVSSRLAVGARRAEHHRRCRQAGEGRRPGGADRRTARPEGLKALDRVERAGRDHRGDGDPDAHVRNDHRDAAADRHGDLRAADDARDHQDARTRGDRADRRADAGDDDRPRRRDRLRAVHRHPPSAGVGSRVWRSRSRSRAPPPPPAAPCSSRAARSRSRSSRWRWPGSRWSRRWA